MKKLLALPIALTVSALILAHGNEMRSTQITMQAKNIQIDYGSPDLNGRDFSQTPVGTVWQLGADRTTTLSTEATLWFGDAKVPQGSFSLLAEKTGADEWKLIVSSSKRPRRANRDKSEDVAMIPFQSGTLEESVGHLSIELTAESDTTAHLTVSWGKTRLSTGFKVG